LSKKFTQHQTLGPIKNVSKMKLHQQDPKRLNSL